MTGLDWEGANRRDQMNRASRRGAGVKRWTKATSYPPTPAQRALIRKLADELGRRPPSARSRQQASGHIEYLLALKRKRKPEK